MNHLYPEETIIYSHTPSFILRIAECHEWLDQTIYICQDYYPATKTHPEVKYLTPQDLEVLLTSRASNLILLAPPLPGKPHQSKFKA